MRRGLSLVVDHETRAILTECNTSAVATYVSEGIPNTFTTNIPTDLKNCREAVSKFDLRKDLVKLSYDVIDGKREYVCSLPSHLITEELKVKKQLAILRAKYISYQESFYRLYIDRAVVVPNVAIIPYLLQELNDCDSDSNTYTSGIREYAEILGITSREAYDELKLLTDNASTIYMRYFGWYKKNVNGINKLHTEDEMTEYSKTVWRNIVNEWNL